MKGKPGKDLTYEALHSLLFQALHPSHGMNTPRAWGCSRIRHLSSADGLCLLLHNIPHTVPHVVPWLELGNAHRFAQCFSRTCTISSLADLLECSDTRLCRSAQDSKLRSQCHKSMATVSSCMLAEPWQTRLFRPLDSWV